VADARDHHRPLGGAPPSAGYMNVQSVGDGRAAICIGCTRRGHGCGGGDQLADVAAGVADGRGRARGARGEAASGFRGGGGGGVGLQYLAKTAVKLVTKAATRLSAGSNFHAGGDACKLLSP